MLCVILSWFWFVGVRMGGHKNQEVNIGRNTK